MILVNGDPAPITDGATIAGLLEALGVEPVARGLAVAVDGEVVPRGEWGQHELRADARVELLTATQGG